LFASLSTIYVKFGFNAHMSSALLLMRYNFGKGNITNKNHIDKLKARGETNSAIHNGTYEVIDSKVVIVELL
jgi:hypothetical protein